VGRLEINSWNILGSEACFLA
jgi:hypothetical protein